MRRARAFGIALCAGLAGGAFGCGREPDQTTLKGAAHSARATRTVSVVKVTTVALTGRLRTTGTLVAQDSVVVSAKVPGRVLSIAVDLGSTVKRGERIAQLEPMDYRLRVAQAQAAVGQARAVLGLPPGGKDSAVDVEQSNLVREARATLDEAEKNRDRSRQLLTRKLIGQAEHDATEANFARAASAIASAREDVYNRQAVLKQRESELQIARQALSDATLTSPLDGIVQTRHTSRGELLSAGSPVATIVSVDPLRLRLDIPDYAANRVQAGQEVRVIGGDDVEHAGKVARVAPAMDPQNRTLAVEAEIPNADSALKPGSFVRAELSFGEESAVLAVPASSVVAFAGIEKVLVVEEGKARELRITTGRREGELVEVTSGLEEGAEVILEPGNLQSGDNVQVGPPKDKTRAEAG